MGAIIAIAAILSTTALCAAEINFVEGLTPEQKAAMGASKLKPAQVAALDELVSHDVTSASEGGVTGFSSAFAARHTASERKAAGIGLLTDAERASLDYYVANAIALGPPPEQPFVYSPPQAKLAAPPPPPPTLVSAPQHGEIHGDVSLTVGGGSHGSSFYGTSLDLNYTDPSGKFTIGVGFDEFHGKGILPLYGPFEPYGPYSAYGPIGPAYIGPPYWGW